MVHFLLQKMERITLAGGCFWCTETIFKRLKGVKSVVSGYAGGEKENPNYEQVSSGQTNHAEAVQIEFDSKIITLEKILEVFWNLVDPTTLNQQGADTGTQYRSVIFYENDSQRESAEESKKKIEQSKTYSNPIVTEIQPLKNFYKAEEFHQNFYEKNMDKPYCQLVINPKIEKLIKQFGESVTQL